jgi:hypothetical protein
MRSVFPINIDSGPLICDELDRPPPPKDDPRFVPEKPPVVPLDDDDRPELRLLDPVSPVEPLELVLVRREELPEIPPELLPALSTYRERAFEATGIKSDTGMYLSSRFKKLSISLGASKIPTRLLM